jgi:hypothetical protein
METRDGFVRDPPLALGHDMLKIECSAEVQQLWFEGVGTEERMNGLNVSQFWK